MSLRALLERAINASWYGGLHWTYLFRPLEGLVKRQVIKRQKKRRAPSAGPVIVVVGNITVGGTGKTPLILTLTEQLQKADISVGIVARGYGGFSDKYPLNVTSLTDVNACGDEAKLLALASGCPVFIDPNRMRAVDALTKNHQVEVILSDDGLQHYALPRDVEIVVVDSSRGFGNAHCLPVGPLREPLERLASVDYVLLNGIHSVTEISSHSSYSFTINPACWKPVASISDSLSNDQSRVETTLEGLNRNIDYLAVAGIGNPERFFNTLTSLAISFQPRIYPDHYNYTVQDLSGSQTPVLMTEKDAVKCCSFAQSNWYYLKITADIAPEFIDQFITKIRTAQSQRISK